MITRSVSGVQRAPRRAGGSAPRPAATGVVACGRGAGAAGVDEPPRRGACGRVRRHGRAQHPCTVAMVAGGGDRSSRRRTHLCAAVRLQQQLRPGLASDASTFGAGGAIRIANAAAGTWRGLVPIPASIGEWNSNLLDGLPGAAWIEAALSLLLFAVILRALRPFPFGAALVDRLTRLRRVLHDSDPAGSVSIRRVRVPALLVVRMVRDRTARRRPRPVPRCPSPATGHRRGSRSCSRPRSSRPSRSTRPRLEPRSHATRHWRGPSTPPTSTTRSCPERTRTGRPSVPTSTARSTRSPATNGSDTSSTTNARPTATAD